MEFFYRNDHRFLELFEALVHKTLRHYQVYPYHCEYEDYAQELRIKLLDLGRRFEGQPLTEDVDRYKFVAYASRGLKWHLVNLLSKKHDLTLRDEEVMDYLDQSVDDYHLESHGTLMAYAAYAKEVLSGEDYLLYQMLMDGTYSVAEMTEILGIQRRTLYHRRDRIAVKLAPLLEK